MPSPIAYSATLKMSKSSHLHERTLGRSATPVESFWEICEDRYQVRSPILTSQPPVSRRAEWDDHHFDAETYWPGAGKLESSSTLPPAPGRS
jgi:hypothetical protein